jgi:two-component sensor histidine kinase
MSRPIGERAVLPGAVQPERGENGKVVHSLVPCLEMMIARSEALSPRLAQIVGVLLDAAHPFRSGGRDVLRPLWAQEAMQRACSILHLAVQLQKKIGACADDDTTARSERRRANNLAVLFRTLHIEQDEEVLPCSDVLRGVVRNLVAVFGSGAGRIVIRTDIEHLSLPAYKRRALVLAASELVINALRHGFAGKSGGRIDVTLRALGTSHVRLSVVDDGVGMSEAQTSGQGGIAVALADLLEGALVYRQSGTVGTNAEIVLPTYNDRRVPTDSRRHLENYDRASAISRSAAA